MMKYLLRFFTSTLVTPAQEGAKGNKQDLSTTQNRAVAYISHVALGPRLRGGDKFGGIFSMIKKYLPCLFLFLALTQCSHVHDYLFEEEDHPFIEEITLTASSDVNRRTPIRVDFVVVKDPVIAEHFAKLTARQYMKQRKQLKRDHPQSIKIESFELIPDQSVVMPLHYVRKEVAAAFIFADYHNQQVNRWKIHAADIVKVKLMANTLTITSHKLGEKETISHARENDGVVVLS